MGDFVGSQRAGTRGGQLESLDGEGEVLVTGVVDQEPVNSRVHAILRQRIALEVYHKWRLVFFLVFG